MHDTITVKQNRAELTMFKLPGYSFMHTLTIRGGRA